MDQQTRRQPMLIYSSWFGDLGGGELRMLDHLRNTRFARERVAVLLNRHGELEQALASERIQSYVIPWKGGENYVMRQWFWYRARLAVTRLLRRLGPGVLVCNTFPDLETTGRVGAALGRPVVWRARADTFPHLKSWPQARARELVSFLNKRVARVLATTEYDMRLMLDAGVDARRVFVVRNGVDLERYRDGAAGRALRNELGLPADRVVIAFVARMVLQKGYETFFEALAAVKAGGRRFTAIVAGDTTLLEDRPEEYKRELLAIVDRLGLTGDVAFLGFRSDVWAVMKAADIFVLASLKEPFGTTVVEAMAASRPVVASDLPGPRESMVEGETGLFFPPGDHRALAERLAALIDDPARRAEMGQRGRLRAEQLFELKRNILELDVHCTEVAEGSS